GSAPPLVGPTFMQRFYSVGDLYSRVKWTMPADKLNNAHSLSVTDDLDVVAYLLQENAVPPGRENLAEDGNAMKAMVLTAGRPAKSAGSITEPLNSLGISQAYYTEEQAQRGKAYFYGACAVCH